MGLSHEGHLIASHRMGDKCLISGAQLLVTPPITRMGTLSLHCGRVAFMEF